MADVTAPLSFAQEQLWFFEQMIPGSTVYNVPVIYRCHGAIDPEALRSALSELVSRHEVLRTRYLVDDGELRQVIEPPRPAELLVDDLSSLAVGPAEQEAMRLAVREARVPFDLARGPVLRARLVRIARTEHVFCLVAHHICTDGWSFALLAGELAEAYRAVVAGREPVLAELAVQYADFAVWQREWLAGEVLEESLGYWGERLAGVPVLELPADRPRPSVFSFRADTLTADLPSDLVTGLRELARERGVSLLMVLVAGFAVVLARYTGLEDVPVGTTVLGRPRPELERLVGLFVNEVVLRVDASGDPPLGGLVDRVREVTLEAYDHQDAPFAKVVERVAPVRDAARNPLFQVLLQLIDGVRATPQLDLPGIVTERLEVYQGQHFLDLSLTMTETAGSLRVLAEFSVDLFDRWRVEGLVRHLERVLRGMVADREVRVSGVDLVSAAERAGLLERGCGPEPFFRAEPVHVVAAERAAAAPDAVAAVCRGAVVSYGELDRRAGGVAGYLRLLGVGHQDVVGVALERGLDVLVALLGVLKAGAAFVVLDLAHPVRRLEFILADTGAAAVVTVSGTLGDLPEPAGWAAVCLDRDREVITGGGGGLAELASAGSLAYVLYTSGSTGKPKGVLVEHRALMMYGAGFSALVDTGPGARLLQYPSLFFDLSLAEVFTTLTSGGTLVLVPQEWLLEPRQLAGLIRREAVTYAGAPPAMMALVDPGPYRDLRQVLVGGEAFSGELVNQWNQPGRRFINSYGPTETVVTCTAYVCEHIDWQSSPPIGSPLPYRRLYVVDRWGNLVPTGVPGELLIGGDEGLARGYLNQPELTSQRFVPDPFRDTGRVYRSGDLVRWTPRGELEFLHRTDSQVKLHGLRLEPEEIEAVLATHPLVAQAVVLLREDPAGEKYLAGYVAHHGTAPSPAELRAHLASEIPAYMLPSAWLILDTLPLRASGKVDRDALPAPARPQRAHVPPRTPAEEQVAAVFAEVLSLPLAGADDNFFELGGSSLQAIRVISRLDDIFGITLSVRHFYSTQATVSSIAAILDASRSPGGPDGHSGHSGHGGPGGKGATSRQARPPGLGRRVPASLIPIVTSGTGAPLVCVHPVSGSVFCYAALARELAADQPVHAFEAAGIDDDLPPISRIEDLASVYVNTLRDQLSGPYQLLGWSMGGLIGYEMARQLAGQGAEVAQLVIIDCLAPASAAITGDGTAGLPAEPQILREFIKDMARAAGRPDPDDTDLSAGTQFTGQAGELALVLAAWQRVGLVQAGVGINVLQRRFRVFRANLLAMHRYRPAGAYLGPVTLIRAADSPDASGPWRTVTRRLDYQVVPGDHYSIWDPAHLPTLAGAVRQCLGQPALLAGDQYLRQPSGPRQHSPGHEASDESWR